MAHLIAVNDTIATNVYGDFSTKRGLMRIANDAVRQAYKDEGLAVPSSLSYEIFSAYCYETVKSYSPITFDGNDVLIHDADFSEFPDAKDRDMTEVDVALFLASHGPGMYRLARSNDAPDGNYRRLSTRLNFWDGLDPAARAHELLLCCDSHPRIAVMQFISDKFAFCEGTRRVYPKCNTMAWDGHIYSKAYWNSSHYVCDLCGEVHAITDTDNYAMAYKWDGARLAPVKACRGCCESSPHVMEETGANIVFTDGLPDGYLSDFHGHTVLTSKLDQCAVCDGCGKVTVRSRTLGMKTYCDNCYRTEHDKAFRGYSHTSAGPDDFKSLGAVDRDLNLYLGVELETVAQPGRDSRVNWAATARDIAEMQGLGRSFVIGKRDGSLDSGGVELVTKPATPLHHLTSGFWDELLSYGSDSDVKTPECCGLHVHVNNDFFDDDRDIEERVTLNRFINRFTEEWLKFSGRTTTEYCEFLSDGDMGIYPEDCARRKRMETSKRVWNRRYLALNNQNCHTSEFRFFAGTMNITDLKGALECAAGLAIMAKTLKLSGDLMEYWEWDDVKSELCAALKSHGLPCEDFVARCKAMGC